MIKSKRSWGYHYIANIGGCDVDCMRSKEHIKEFLSTLLDATDMKAVGAPIFKYIAPSKETIDKEIDGYSVVQIIMTSSITMHLVESTQMIFFDFFSCKKFSKAKVRQLLRSYFKNTRIEESYLTRDTLV